MGNAQSEEEAKGTGVGGFLGLLGGLVVSIVWPPAAAIAAAIAIPVGFAAHGYGMATQIKYDNKPPEERTNKGTTGDFVGGIIQGTTFGGLFQPGVNYKDNDTRPHLHYCPTNSNPVSLREQKESKELYEKQMKEERIKQYKENLNEYMEDTFKVYKGHMSHTYIKNSYGELSKKFKKESNFQDYKLIDFTNLYHKYLRSTDNLKKFESHLDIKLLIVCLTLNKIKPILEKLSKEQDAKLKLSYSNLLSATIYGLNALENVKVFESEMSSIQYAPYANQMNESLHNYCAQMKSAFINFLGACKDACKSGRTMAKIENTIDKMYDKVAEAKAMSKPICKKYGIYIDSEKYKLNLEGKIKKIDEFVKNNKEFNTYNYHHEIYKIAEVLNELMKD